VLSCARNAPHFRARNGSLLVLQLVSIADDFVMVFDMGTTSNIHVCSFSRAKRATCSGPDGSLLMLQIVSIADALVMVLDTGTN
jgi:hypothetical protein